MALCVAIALTSYYRHRIPYEVFSAVHRLVLLLYLFTVLHTLDKVHRSGLEDRYQTYYWISASFLFYITDLAFLKLNRTYKARLLKSVTLSGSNGSATVILKFKRPPLFQFHAGQYAFIRLKEIDRHWHPFTIASEPSSHVLEFYIEVFGDGSWTSKLFELLGHSEDDDAGSFCNIRLYFDLQGPYGTSLGKTEDYSHALAIGSGTGRSCTMLQVCASCSVHLTKCFTMTRDCTRTKLVQATRAPARSPGPRLTH